MIKLLIGGSPCTYWSIAQKNNRETEPSGMGWELFKNYLIAKEKFKPDFFLYENNKSAAQAIKDQIKKELGVTGCLFEENAQGQFFIGDGAFYDTDAGARYIEINSALVSAQNRQRFYVHNCGDVVQPCDRGILLRDVLESGVCWKDKSACIDANYHKASNGSTPMERQSGKRLQVAEPVRIPEYLSDKARPLTSSYKNKGSGEGSLVSECFPDNPNKQVFDYIAEPVNTTADGKAKALRASADKDGIRNFVGNENDKRTCVAEPVCVQEQVFGRQADDNGEYDRRYEARTDRKSGSLTGTNRQNAVAEPVNVTPDGKAQTLKAQYSKNNEMNFCCYHSTYGATGVAEQVYYGAEAVEFDENGKPTKARSYADGKIYTVYEVRDGKITIKGKEYPIKLADGFYIIRKLTVKECCRLQTLPDDYCRAVSASQAYKGLGNGWTAEVIIHILSNALKDIPRDEKVLVLSMYDGIGTGRYCLDKMGFTNVEYHAYEIDKYAMQIAMSNYPDIIQHGDAFAVREKGWRL